MIIQRLKQLLASRQPQPIKEECPHDEEEIQNILRREEEAARRNDAYEELAKTLRERENNG